VVTFGGPVLEQFIFSSFFKHSHNSPGGNKWLQGLVEARASVWLGLVRDEVSGFQQPVEKKSMQPARTYRRGIILSTAQNFLSFERGRTWGPSRNSSNITYYPYFIYLLTMVLLKNFFFSFFLWQISTSYEHMAMILLGHNPCFIC
jgi:hypothetical protein